MALNALPLGEVALVGLVAYGMYYGVIEATGMRGLRAPGTTWQVPKTLVGVDRSRWRRLLTWGSLLGPGFATRNPYAGFGLLLLAVAAPGNVLVGVVLGASVGALHGAGRGLALLRDARGIEGADYLEAVVRSLYWRTADGLALLAIGAMALVTVLDGPPL